MYYIYIYFIIINNVQICIYLKASFMIEVRTNKRINDIASNR